MKAVVRGSGQCRIGTGLFVVLYALVLAASPVCVGTGLVPVPGSQTHSHDTAHALPCSAVCQSQADTGLVPDMPPDAPVVSAAIGAETRFSPSAHSRSSVIRSRAPPAPLAS
ncbi:hypothetical protein NSND_61393 [Nitrospira sp. ND1]|nr:hypothetical protein NSND_61393 [Nitrospira sp. ND1]